MCFTFFLNHLVSGYVVDPSHFGTDPDQRIRASDHRYGYFRPWPSRCQQKTELFSAYRFTFWRYSYINSLRQKVINKSQNSRNKGFLIKEGFGSVPLTNGSGSRRPKNIRIHNIGFMFMSVFFPKLNVLSSVPDPAESVPVSNCFTGPNPYHLI